MDDVTQSDSLYIGNTYPALANFAQKSSILSEAVAHMQMPSLFADISKQSTILSDPINQMQMPTDFAEIFEHGATLSETLSQVKVSSLFTKVEDHLASVSLIEENLGKFCDDIATLKADVYPAVESMANATRALSGLCNTNALSSIANKCQDASGWIREANSAALKIADFDLGLTQPLKAFNGMMEPIKATDLYIETGLAKLSTLSALTLDSINGLGTTNLGQMLGLVNESSMALVASLNGLTANFQDFFGEITMEVERFANFDPQLSRLTHEELFLHSSLLESVSIPHSHESTKAKTSQLVEENEEDLEYRLGYLDKGLVKMWKGARNSLLSDNPDRVRHFSASIRELLLSILRMLAPDKEVANWTNNLDHFHKGKPNRRARILYICREKGIESFEKVVEMDIKAFLEIFELLNGGVHKVTYNLTDYQLLTIRGRAELAINYLITIKIGF